MKYTMTLNMSDKEFAALERLSERLELSKSAVLRQGLRLYDLIQQRVDAGVTIHLHDPKMPHKKFELALLMPKENR